MLSETLHAFICVCGYTELTKPQLSSPWRRDVVCCLCICICMLMIYLFIYKSATEYGGTQFCSLDFNTLFEKHDCFMKIII